MRSEKCVLGSHGVLPRFERSRLTTTIGLASRTASALALLNEGGAGSAIERQPLRDLASMLGMPEDVLARLVNDVVAAGLAVNSSVSDWCGWMFQWLEQHPEDMFRLLKIENLENLLGASFKSFETDAERAAFSVPILQAALQKWMSGLPLMDIQTVLSTKTRDIKHSTSARKFVIRVVPELAHVLGAPLQIFHAIGQRWEGGTARTEPGISVP